MGKMMAPNESIFWVPKEQAATVTEVLKATVYTNPGAKAVDISCAIATGYKLGATASDTNDDSDICQEENVKNPTRGNYEGSLTFFREDLGGKDAAGDETVRDKAYNLFKGMDRPEGWLVHRVGHKQSVPMKAGQDVSVFLFRADLMQFVAPDAGGTIKYTVEFLPQGAMKLGAKLT